MCVCVGERGGGGKVGGEEGEGVQGCMCVGGAGEGRREGRGEGV